MIDYIISRAVTKYIPPPTTKWPPLAPSADGTTMTEGDPKEHAMKQFIKLENYEIIFFNYLLLSSCCYHNFSAVGDLDFHRGYVDPGNIQGIPN